MPSASMVMPWARRTWPSPHERRNLPSRLKTMTGCSPRVKQKTLSLASTATPATSTKCQPSGSLPQPSMTLKFMLAGLLEGLVHALEAPAQGLPGLFVGDDIEPVDLDGPQHAPRHVLRLEVTTDQLEPVVVLRPLGILQMRGTKASTPWMTPQRLTASTHSQSRWVAASSPPWMATPALLQTMCTPPISAQARSARASTEASFVTSVLTVSALVPAFFTPAAVSAMPASSMSATTTWAPSPAKARQRARPIPLAPPVTTAVLPLRFSMWSPCGWTR